MLVRRDDELTKEQVDQRMKEVLGPRGGRSTTFGGTMDRGAYAAGREAGQAISLGGNGRSLGAAKARIR